MKTIEFLNYKKMDMRKVKPKKSDGYRERVEAAQKSGKFVSVYIHCVHSYHSSSGNTALYVLSNGEALFCYNYEVEGNDNHMLHFKSVKQFINVACVKCAKMSVSTKSLISNNEELRKLVLKPLGI